MLTITASHLRRLAATVLIGCAILLPPFFSRASAQSVPVPAALTVASVPAAF